MPPWVTSAVSVLQLVVNVGALVGGAIIWKLYVDNLKAALTSKDAEISSVEKNRDMWRDKALEFEKRSPEAMELLLSERIKIRESEIARLADDKGKHEEALKQLQREKSSLETDLSRTRGFRLMLALDEEGPEGDGKQELVDAGLPPVSEIQVVLLGEVGVDSGQLMITDPCYIDQEWQRYDPSAALPKTAKDQERVLGPGGPASDVEENLAPFSYQGAMKTTLSAGYGELAFTLGHAGAGVVFHTAWGDGTYPVYGELHDGRVVRAYINVG